MDAISKNPWAHTILIVLGLVIAVFGFINPRFDDVNDRIDSLDSSLNSLEAEVIANTAAIAHVASELDNIADMIIVAHTNGEVVVTESELRAIADRIPAPPE